MFKNDFEYITLKKQSFENNDNNIQINLKEVVEFFLPTRKEKKISQLRIF